MRLYERSYVRNGKNHPHNCQLVKKMWLKGKERKKETRNLAAKDAINAMFLLRPWGLYIIPKYSK